MRDWRAIGLISGLSVLIAGIVVIQSISAVPSPTTESPAAVETVVAPATTATPQQPTTPKVNGIGEEIQRVLHRFGNTEVVGPSELDELPPEVVSVLTHYGATLTIADPTAGATG